MKCPKCKDGILEEDYFDKNLAICDKCYGAFREGGE